MSGRLLAVPLPPLPEIRPGDDLGRLLAEAWWTLMTDDHALAPAAGDVLVVTQKVVSKAEGRIVRLAEVEPRPEAVDWARAWDKDPRQVEVVLRETAEVVRMERGIIISRTIHGFVCANAGVDASNVGGDEVVTLLPQDPDASATGLRQALLEELGVDVSVIVSDSFGRPWRVGITDVALGVSGFAPLDDLRGRARRRRPRDARDRGRRGRRAGLDRRAGLGQDQPSAGGAHPRSAAAARTRFHRSRRGHATRARPLRLGAGPGAAGTADPAR